MKKIITILFLSLLISNTCFSQSGWFQLNSPVSNGIASVFFINRDTGFIGMGGGVVYKTLNGGSNWININVNTTNIIGGIFFLDNNTGYSITGSECFKTTDGGSNWNNINFSFFGLNDMFFLNASTGYLTNGLFVLKTLNGGLTWDTCYMEQTIGTVGVNCVWFLNTSTGMAGGNWDYPHVRFLRIWRTTDSGQNWGIVYHPPGGVFRDISFANNNIGYAVGESGSMAKTTNGGLNWFALSFGASNVQLFNVSTFSETKIFTCGYQGLWASVNGGFNWSSVQIPTVTYYSMHFPDSIVGYVVGQNGYIFKTTNGGNPLGLNKIGYSLPSSFFLSQNYPNPFNPVTRIRFSLPVPSKGGVWYNVRLVIYDILGREIETIIPSPGGGQEGLKPGSYEVRWDGSRYASGVYFYRLFIDDASSPQANPFSITKKMVLIK